MGSKFFTMVGGGAGGEGIKLESIAITTPPDNITYLPGEVFDPAGMVVTASYSNGATLTATGWTYSPSGALPEGTSEVEIIYTEAGVTKTAVQAITVERGTISVPTVSGSLTYNGQAQSPTLTGYDSDKMVLSGDTSGTNAGSYTAVVTPTEQYKWADGSTEAKDIQWSIAKATPSITFDPASVSLDTSTTSQAVAVTYTGDGTLSAQSDNSGVATASLEGTTGHPGIGQRGDKLHGGQCLSECGGAVCDYHSGGSNTERKPDIQTIYVANSIMEQLRPGSADHWRECQRHQCRDLHRNIYS